MGSSMDRVSPGDLDRTLSKKGTRMRSPRSAFSTLRLRSELQFSAIRPVLVGLAMQATMLFPAHPACAQPADQHLWVTNGSVFSVVRAGGTIYLGGTFTQVGPATGGCVPI